MKLLCKDCGGQATYNEHSNMVICAQCGGTNFKYEFEEICPHCNGILDYDKKNDKIYCTDCRKEYIEQDEINISNEFSTNDLEEYESTTYECTCCGAQITVEPNTVATKCPFCDSQINIVTNLRGSAKPYGIIPFKYDRNYAESEVRKWCKGGIVLPKEFKHGTKIGLEVKPIYIPFWLYDIDSNGRIEFNARKTKTRKTGDYIIKTTYTYRCVREIDNISINNLPCDASKRMNDKLMNLLEPFNFNDLKEFNIGYLSGNLTEKYDYTSEELLDIAKNKTSNILIDFAQQSVINKYDNASYISKKLNLTTKRADYILLPIWTLVCNYKGKEYMFAMNGQTGKVVGKPPIDISKVISIGMMVAVVVTTLLNFLI